MTEKLDVWPKKKNNGTHLLGYMKLCALFQSHQWIQTWLTIHKRSIRVKMGDFFPRVTLKLDGWPWKTIGHLFYTTSSFVHHFIAISELKPELQSGYAQFGSKSTIFKPCDLEIWWITLKNNRAPLLSNIKLYASFHHHMQIQTGVTVQKRLSWVMTSVTLTFDLYLWTLIFCIEITFVIGNNSWKFRGITMTGT